MYNTVLFILDDQAEEVKACLRDRDREALQRLVEREIETGFRAYHGDSRMMSFDFNRGANQFLAGYETPDLARVAVSAWNDWVRKDFMTALGELMQVWPVMPADDAPKQAVYAVYNTAGALCDHTTTDSKRIVYWQRSRVMRSLLWKEQVQELMARPEQIVIVKVQCLPF
jgi:hypothetical protein